ncbi:MAG: hypothetical protein E6Q84_01100 [Thiothrix sp.]|nr:MAG: hypothetical protein E6Q84_01100 [Thiothrix sp.]
MEIKIPSIQEQQRFIFEQATREAIRQLEENLNAPVVQDLAIDESQYSNEHLLPESRWKPPHADVAYAYIEQLKRHSDHKTDKAVAEFLGLRGNNAERRLRAYREGSESPPYGVWRRLLVATGRVPQEIIPVIAFMR